MLIVLRRWHCADRAVHLCLSSCQTSHSLRSSVTLILSDVSFIAPICAPSVHLSHEKLVRSVTPSVAHSRVTLQSDLPGRDCTDLCVCAVSFLKLSTQANMSPRTPNGGFMMTLGWILIIGQSCSATGKHPELFRDLDDWLSPL